MPALVLLGAGGHAREVAELALRCGVPHLGFVDDDESKWGRLFCDRPVLGGFSWLEAQDRQKIVLVSCCGSPLVQRSLVQRALALGFNFAVLVSTKAHVSPSCVLGVGTVLFENTVVHTGARIGDHVTLNVGVSVSHDSVVGSFSNLNPGSRLAGGVTLGEGCYLGMGSNVIQSITVGEWTTVGAGAVVIQDLPARVTAVGVPARVRREA